MIEFDKAYNEWHDQRPSVGESWQDGCDLMRNVVDVAPEHYGVGLQTLMSASLLETWAAVEALLGDIWTIALDTVPDPLAANFFGTEKSFPVSMLKRHGFDLSSRMGSVAKEFGKVDMNSFAGLKTAYKTAFGKDYPQAVFDTYNADISHLEAIRNLFAHQSGRVDKRFLDRVKQSPELSTYADGQTFVVTGDLMSFYTGRSVAFACELFSFTDRWVADHRS